MKRRVFAAIPVPEEIKKEIINWQESHQNLSVRWIKLENLHITVVPPWYADENELYEATKVIETAVKNSASFEVKFGKVLFGPPGQPPRLIWAEGEATEEFKRLKSLIEDALLKERTGFMRAERRPAKLHLTIARFRPGSIKKLPQLHEEVDWKFEVNEITLMESELKRTGAEYSILKTLPLG